MLRPNISMSRVYGKSCSRFFSDPSPPLLAARYTFIAVCFLSEEKFYPSTYIHLLPHTDDGNIETFYTFTSSITITSSSLDEHHLPLRLPVYHTSALDTFHIFDSIHYLVKKHILSKSLVDENRLDKDLFVHFKLMAPLKRETYLVDYKTRLTILNK